NIRAIFMGDVIDGFNLFSWCQSKGATSPFDTVNPLSCKIKDILHVSGSIGGIVWGSDLSQAYCTRLLWPVCAWNKVKGNIVFGCVGHDFPFCGQSLK